MSPMLQIFSVAVLVAAAASAQTTELQPGRKYQLALRDVDGSNLKTDAGHVTIITVVTRQNEQQARAVAAMVPDRCIGDPKYRYITLVNFQRKISPVFQGITNTVIRRRLDAEAKRLEPDYTARKLTRDPRRDIFVVADFDGAAVGQLGLAPTAHAVAVFVFNGEGKLIARWTGVPPEGALAKAIAAAE